MRAVWDDATNGWFFSVLDVVGVLNAQDDYAKNRELFMKGIDYSYYYEENN